MNEVIQNKQIRANAAEIFAIVCTSYLLIIVYVFSDTLFSPENMVLSSARTDVYQQYIHWRNFGFSELSEGNVALWNPHIFSGAPFMAGFQSALFYPPNLIYCMLPLADAINWSIVINMTIAGICMFYWTRFHGVHFLAAYLAGLLFVFCAPQFLHVYAGHLSNLCTMAWVPLVFLSIDGLSRTLNEVLNRKRVKRSCCWIMLGMTAVSMQILAGHPQYVYYTAIAAMTYVLFHLIGHENKKWLLAGAFLIYTGSALLSAVQLLPGYEAYLQGTRGSDVSIEFSGTFSFPFENLLTVLVPDFFGSFQNYWGRWYYWEMSLFFTVSGLVMAVSGLVVGKLRIRWCAAGMILVLFILAMGKYTPVFSILHACVPGFDSFRGSSKFTLQLSAFAILLSALGMNYFFRTEKLFSRIPTALLVTLAAAGCVCVIIFNMELSKIPGDNFWGSAQHFILETKSSYIPAAKYEDPEFQKESAAILINSAFISIIALTALAGIFTWLRYNHYGKYGIAVLMLCEMLIFAKYHVDSFDLSKQLPYQLESYYKMSPNSHRVRSYDQNLGMTLNGYDIWGTDASTPQRYAELITYIMGHNPNNSTRSQMFGYYQIKDSRVVQLLAMLRCKYDITVSDNKLKINQLTDKIAPEAMIVHDYHVIRDRDLIFQYMLSGFSYKTQAILEGEPKIVPKPPTGRENAEVIEYSTDHMIIEADLSSDGILVVTDSYDKYWSAWKIDGDTEAELKIVPANYVLRAIPLPAGKHTIRLEYNPPAFKTGKYISIATLLFIAVGMFICRPPRKEASK